MTKKVTKNINTPYAYREGGIPEDFYLGSPHANSLCKTNADWYNH